MLAHFRLGLCPAGRGIVLTDGGYVLPDGGFVLTDGP